MPDLDVRRLDRIVTGVAEVRAAALNAMVEARHGAALEHCRFRGVTAATFPVLTTNGVTAVEGTEQVDLCCGVCHTPVARLRFAVTLTVEDPRRPPEPARA